MGQLLGISFLIPGESQEQNSDHQASLGSRSLMHLVTLHLKGEEGSSKLVRAQLTFPLYTIGIPCLRDSPTVKRSLLT